ncbi:MAG TPA: sigma-70 family RNA polymerase sigma factor [Pyrinomonadaceae bacterium]|nr:sigma-70 family RNA polymerase sigma factor [Pyrinomonadaceae bacterium]
MNNTRALVVKATASTSTFAERHEAFGELVTMFQDMAYGCAYAALGDFHLAEDAAQGAFVTAWQRLQQLRQPEAFPGWLRRIVLTECSRMTRGKRPRLVTLDASAHVASGGVGPQEALERDQLKSAVRAAVESLPRAERMAVVLFYVREHSHRDIGEFLGVPTTTVAKRLHTARARLKGIIMGAFSDDFKTRRPSRDASFAEKVRAGIYDCYAGQYRYELRPDLVVTIRRDGDKLFSEAAGQTNELFAQGDAEAELCTREFDGRGEFERDARGRVTHFVYFEFGKEMGRALKIG